LKQEVEQKAKALQEIEREEAEKATLEAANKAKEKEIEKNAEKHLKQIFFEELGRELTEQEYKTYKELFDKDLTDFYTYSEGLKNGTQ